MKSPIKYLVLDGGGSTGLHAEGLLAGSGLDVGGSWGSSAWGDGIESLAGLDEGHGELAANGDLLEHAGNLEVAAASQVSAVDGLDVVSNSDLGDAGLKNSGQE